MDTLKTKFRNLGDKHKYFNEVVKQAISNNHTNFTLENEDVNILAKIDIASHSRNVEYILDILKSDDLLYVSRAIKKCTWLVTDNSYAHIFDPDYLKTHLYPNMTAKAQNKLHKHIRNNIKDELRAEMFYNAEDNIDAAFKWLPACSISFIECEVVKHHAKIKKTRLFKRLCERSINILNLIDESSLSKDKIQAAKFVQKIDVNLFLKTIDRMPSYETLKFNKKTTKWLMTSCPNIIIDNFDKYCKNIDIPTFAKYLKPEGVKEFIYKQASLADMFPLRFLFNTQGFQHLVQRIPDDERFDFVNKVFIEQVHKSCFADNSPDPEITKMNKLFNLFHCPKYEWYKFAPFEVAFNEIERYNSCYEKNDFLKFLLKCCKNQSHFQSVLKYYRDKHNKDSYDHKINFVDELLSNCNFCFYDNTNWCILNDIFKTLHVYSESNDESSKYVEIVIVYKLIKNEPIEEQIIKRFVFNNTLINYCKKLKPDEQFRVFHFVFNHVLKKTQDLNIIENEDQFYSILESLKSVLDLLKDWSKELNDYPFVLQKVKDLVKIKTEKSWTVDLSCLYNIKKSWKQLMFEESLILEPSEKVCINALKHDPGLLERFEDNVEYMLNNNKYYLREFLRKVRIYYSESLAKRLITKYLPRLEEDIDHNVVIRNLFSVMTQGESLNTINKFVPKEAKINWDEEDGSLLNLRWHVAKNMHFIRPHPPPDAILAYAKGDYLQYAVPSVLAIFYNLNSTLFRENILKLFNSPVSLQKLGIRLSITKMRYDDLVKEFHDLWINTKNISIRSIIFQLTFKLLRRQNDDLKIQEFWYLLKMFIDNLTFKEDKAVYSLMYNTDGIPHTIKANFIERNHIFLESYLEYVDTNIDEFERYYMEEKLMLNCSDVMENMNEDFIVRVLKKFIDTKFFCKSPHAKQPRRRYINPCDGLISILSVYLLCAKDEKTQEIKYETILLPILERGLGKLKAEYRWKENIKTLLDYLRQNLDQYALKNKMVMPLKMFSQINEELTKSLNVPEYYGLLTQWKLTVEYVKNLSRTIENNEVKVSLDTKSFSDNCLEILKEDVEKHFPRIYLIFHKVLYDTLKDLCDEDEMVQIYTNMLSNTDFIPGYLTVLKIAATYYDKSGTWDEILHLLEGHQSEEIKMNYYYFFNEY